MKKVVLAVTLALTGVAVLYLAGLNLILRTRIFRDLLNGAQHDIVVDYERAYSFWPGRVNVSGLTIRGEDYNVQWWLRIDYCEFDVALAALRRRRFHATRVRADGFMLRARLKFTEASPEHVAALPVVPWFGPPLRPRGPPPPPPTDEEYNLWSVQLDDVDVVHAGEVWVDILRFAGDMRVRGRWLFRPVRLLDVGPATIDGLSSVSYGREDVLTKLSGSIEATMHPLDIRPPGPPEFVRHTSLSTDVVGLVDGAALANMVGLGRGIRISSADGAIRVAGVVDHGTMRPGTHASVLVQRTDAHGFGADVRGSLAVNLRVEQPPGRSPTATAEVDLRGLRLVKARAAATLPSLSVRLHSQQLELIAPFGDAVWTATFSGLASNELVPWGELISGAYRVRAGALRADGTLEGSVAERQISGYVDLALSGLAVAHDRQEWTGDVRAALSIDRALLDSGSIQFGASRAAFAGPALRAAGVSASAKRASIDLGSLVIDGGRLRRAMARVEIAQLVVRAGGIDAHGDVSAKAQLGIRPGSGIPVVSSGELAMTDVRICDSGAAPLESCAVAPRVELQVRDLSAVTRGVGFRGMLGIRIPHAEGSVPPQLFAAMPRGLQADGGRGEAVLRAEVDLAAMTASGEADIRVAGVRLQAGSHIALGAASVQVLAHRLDDGSTDLSGSSIRLLGCRPGRTDDWWGDVELRKGALRPSADEKLRAAMHVSARDASPFVAIVAATTSVPEWLANIPATTGVEGDGELLVGKSSVALQSVDARGGDVRLRLAYTKRPDGSQGALLFSFGPLSAGFGLGGVEPGFVLFGAEQWFNSAAARLRPGLR